MAHLVFFTHAHKLITPSDCDELFYTTYPPKNGIVVDDAEAKKHGAFKIHQALAVLIDPGSPVSSCQGA